MKKTKKFKQIYRQKTFWLAITVIPTLAVAIFVGVLAINLPDVRIIQEKNLQPLIHIMDNEEVLIKTLGTQDSNYIVYEELPGYLIDAVVAIEDRKFFKHHGVDLLALPRAVIKNITAGRYAQGASTITQQLAKLYFLTPEKTIRRKVKEMLLALKVEKHYSKKEILELYLNKAYFGSGNYGISSACNDYFGKSVEEISLHEAALLAGLLKAPSKYSPKVNPDLSEKRTNLVLDTMLKNNVITEEEYVISQYQDNAWDGSLSNTDNHKYFLDYVLNLAEEEQNIFPFDITINTSFDRKLHRIADQTISNFYAISPELKNTQIAFVAMAKDGAILSMIGGYNYKKSQYNRSIYAKRQPGSSFKLFTYLEALKQGYDNDYKVIDEEFEIDGWQPKNYDETYRGEMTLREAFVRSINSVAAKLAQEVKIKNVISTAKDLGITSKIPQLPSIALGTNEVTLLEMVAAYTAIANEGYKVKPYVIADITDNYRNILYKDDYELERVLDKKTANKMANLLHGVVVWGTGHKANVEGLKIHGKTGTSQNYRDAWFIGFNEEITMGIWIGNDKNEPLENITGGSYPAKIFSEIMGKYYY